MVAINLAEESFPARRNLFGADTFTLAAEQALKIETSPGGEEKLAQIVPAGKEWSVTVSVRIEETDV